MSTIFPTSIPTKSLQASITASASSFALTDILGWSGSALTAADFGTVAYAVFRNTNNTTMEIMEIDPATIASASITILRRGLNYTGDLTTESSTRKYSWVKGTRVELGSHVPQLLKHFVTDIGDQTIAGVKTFSSLPTIPATPSAATDAASKGYVDGVVVAGAPNASTTVKGIVEEATQAEVRARTAAGGTAAELFVNPSTIPNVLISDYVADTGTATAYAIAPSPAIVAYVTGQQFTFKATNANSSTTPTLNVNALGAKTIVKRGAIAVAVGDIAANAIVQVEYDGTNMQILSVLGKEKVSQDGSEIYALDAAGSDTYAITLIPAPTAYVTGMVVNFKAGAANTGAATLNVNGLGAISIKRNLNATLATGDIQANQIVSVIYDGTNFQLLSGQPFVVKSGSTTRSGSAASGSQTIAHGLGSTPRFIRIRANCKVTNSFMPAFSDGTYDGTTTLGMAISLDAGNGNSTFYNTLDSTNIINIQKLVIGTTGSQVASATVDDTNITLAWTQSGASLSNDINIAWEAIA